MTTHKVSAETPSPFFTAQTSAQNLRSPFRYEAGLPSFFTSPAEDPGPLYPVSPDTSLFFWCAGFAPDPLLQKHFGKAPTVKTNQLTRVLPSFFYGLSAHPEPLFQSPPDWRRYGGDTDRSGKVYL
jgi:hypothetical protein